MLTIKLSNQRPIRIASRTVETKPLVKYLGDIKNNSEARNNKIAKNH